MKIIANGYKAKEIFKFIRENSGLSQTDFGKRISRKRNSIQNYEYGNRKYSFELLLLIAKEFDLEIIIRDKER